MNTKGRCKRPGGERGFTLIELIVALVIIATAAATILGVMSAVDSRSAEAMQRTQAISIANAYLREIIAQPFVDPAGADGEVARAAFDDVDDYNNLPTATVSDRFGNPIAGLDNYQVAVNVTQTAIGPGGALVAANRSLRITVTVTSPSQYIVSLSAFRTRHQ